MSPVDVGVLEDGVRIGNVVWKSAHFGKKLYVSRFVLEEIMFIEMEKSGTAVYYIRIFRV